MHSDAEIGMALVAFGFLVIVAFALTYIGLENKLDHIAKLIEKLLKGEGA